MKIIVNGEIVDRSGTHIDIEDRSYQFGDGVYEVVGIYNGNFFKMEEHLQRLQRSANEIRITLPDRLENIEKQLTELRQLNQVEDGIIYFQVSRGVAPRDHAFPKEKVEPVFIAYTKAMPQPKTEQEQGVSCLLVDDIRWLRCDIKSLNLLGNVLAREKAVAENCYEAILHRDGTVTEGSATNFFIVKDGKLYTHPVNQYILKGITRGVVQDICQKLDIEVVEEPFTVEEMFSADEAFISGTYIDVIPVNEIDGKKINTGEPGPITRKIQEKFKTLVG